MKDIVIIGAGNFGREVAQLVDDINMDKKTWNLLGFIDETVEKHGTIINSNIVLGGFDWLEKNRSDKLFAICAIGNPRYKYHVIKKVSGDGLNFANLIHQDAKISKFVEMGNGNIICCNSFISVNVKVGNHVSINPGCGIGHDVVIGDYSSLYWNVTLSGNVNIGEGCEIGSKADIIPKTNVGKWSIIGAGAVAIEDIPDNCTAVGIPAKTIKFLQPVIS
ncbi:MAG: bacterial transferase, hexapeptide repeat family [Eubacterium sp.]|jgi:sugar O-acyltransferase (sialic acid O-acetyltransferase NeuD family)|nr:bacterial transferase, hexapeptide repeat family [Eubacterium sp.]